MTHRKLHKKLIGILIPAVIILFSYYVLPYLNSSFGSTDTDGLPIKVYFIDVGQGDASLIDVDGKFVMIDGGTDDSADDTIAFITSLGVTKLDCVVATHPHEDHIGGLDDIINEFPTAKAYISQGGTTTRAFENLLSALENSDVETVSAGDVFKVGKAKFEVFAPENKEYSELNNYSVCLKMTYGSKSFLFTGDAEKLSENEMLASGFNLNSDVLKVGHHGSETSTSDKFLKAVSPEFSVVSVGRNSYGLPDENVIGRLEVCSKLYRTDLNGNIAVTTDGKTLEVKCDYN